VALDSLFYTHLIGGEINLRIKVHASAKSCDKGCGDEGLGVAAEATTPVVITATRATAAATTIGAGTPCVRTGLYITTTPWLLLLLLLRRRRRRRCRPTPRLLRQRRLLLLLLLLLRGTPACSPWGWWCRIATLLTHSIEI
jgi:hypothetical protein